MAKDVQDQKQQLILEAAREAFASYGFRKTSMDDIARGAGLSRASLYLHYRNKEDIFRSLVLQCYDACASILHDILSDEGALAEVLERAFLAQSEIVVRPLLNSSHGLELLDAGNAAASDLVVEGEKRIRSLYARWLQRRADMGGADLPEGADAIALAVGASLKGAKIVASDYDEYCRIVTAQAQILGRALSR